jgi:hypothetical protein
MTIYNPTDHGFYAESAPIQVHKGDVFRLRTAEALYDVAVYRTHRDAGYWEVEFLNGPRVGAIDVMSERKIIDALRAA